MLSEEYIEKLMQPIIDRQEAINNWVIQKIATRVRKIVALSPSDVYKLTRLRALGADVKQINKALAEATKLNERDIKKLIKKAAEENYLDAKPLYDYRHKSFIPFEQNVELQAIVKVIADQTAKEYVNMARVRAFMIRDLANPKKLIPTSIAKTYQSIIDEAVQMSQSGVVDYNTAISRSLQQLNESGIRYVIYHAESGKKFTQRLDTAVRRNILDGIRAINQGVQDEIGKQIDADGKEITVHANSAPDHEPIQGHQFKNSEYDKLQNGESFRDVNGKIFGPIDRAIGTYNCRHFTYSIIIGYSKPMYSQKELDEMIKKNNEGYTLSNGKHLTMYECTQYQRKLETDIRKNKDGQMMAEAAGNDKLAAKYKARVAQLTKNYNAFSKQSGLAPRKDKLRVKGYKFN